MKRKLKPSSGVGLFSDLAETGAESERGFRRWKPSPQPAHRCSDRGMVWQELGWGARPAERPTCCRGELGQRSETANARPQASFGRNEGKGARQSGWQAILRPETAARIVQAETRRGAPTADRRRRRTQGYQWVGLRSAEGI